MAGFEPPSQEGPIQPNNPPPSLPTQGMVTWTHIETEPALIGPAAMQTARLGTWDSLDPATRARHLRAFVAMSLQAATLSTEPQKLGVLSAASYAGDERNAIGAAVARSLLLIAPRGVTLVSQNMLTTNGQPPVMVPSTETGLGPVAIVAIVAVAAAAAYVIGRYTGETADRADFRDTKTRQLVSTQAAVIETLSTHAQRERLAGKPLPFSPEERRLLESLEQTQQQIAAERHQPLPSPFDGAKSLAELGRSVTGVIESLLPIAAIGGALYLISRYGGSSEPERGSSEAHGRAAEPATNSQTITLTRNKEGIYEQQE